MINVFRILFTKDYLNVFIFDCVISKINKNGLTFFETARITMTSGCSTFYFNKIFTYDFFSCYVFARRDAATVAAAIVAIDTPISGDEDGNNTRIIIIVVVVVVIMLLAVITLVIVIIVYRRKRREYTYINIDGRGSTYSLGVVGSDFFAVKWVGLNCVRFCAKN